MQLGDTPEHDLKEACMIEAKLSKVGNSMAVLLPKKLRAEAAFGPDEAVRLESPRKGVVVITALLSDEGDRLARLEGAESRIRERQSSTRPWPEGMTADAMLAAGKDARSDEFSVL